MVRQSTSKGAAPSATYAAANAVVWVIYAALVLLVPWVLAFSDPAGVTASVLVAAVVLLPLRRRMSRAARRRFTRLPGAVHARQPVSNGRAPATWCGGGRVKDHRQDGRRGVTFPRTTPSRG